MTKTQVPLVGPTAEDESKDLNPQRTVNFYLRSGGPGGMTRAALVGTPGLVFETILTTTGPVRGMVEVTISNSPRIFVVAGTKLYEVTAAMTVTERGTIGTATGAVDLVWNGSQLMVVEALKNSTTSKAYLYDTSNETFTDLMTLESLDFTSGGTYEIAPGDTITGATSGATAYVSKVEVSSGSWAAGDAAGTLTICSRVGSFIAEDLDVGTNLNVATISTNPVDIAPNLHPTRGAVIDGRFLLNENNSQKFWWSDLLDGLSWPALNFASAEINPDELVGLYVSHHAVWLFGERTTEVWTPSGDPDLPFSKIPGAAIEWGCAAPMSVANLGNDIVWLAMSPRGKGQLVRAVGYSSVEPITSPAIAAEISRFSDASDAVAWTVEFDGYEFYIITFPTENRTFMLSPQGGWTELAYWNSTTGEFERHLATCGAYMSGPDKYLVGSRVDGTLYRFDPDATTDSGDPIRRMRVSQPMHADGRRMFWHEFELIAETGAAASATDDEPYVLLSWSDDGGHTWSNEHSRSLGAVGERSLRVRWTRLGTSISRVWRITTMSTVPVRILGAWATFSVGA